MQSQSPGTEQVLAVQAVISRGIRLVCSESLQKWVSSKQQDVNECMELMLNRGPANMLRSLRSYQPTLQDVKEEKERLLGHKALAKKFCKVDDEKFTGYCVGGIFIQDLFDAFASIGIPMKYIAPEGVPQIDVFWPMKETFTDFDPDMELYACRDVTLTNAQRLEAVDGYIPSVETVLDWMLDSAIKGMLQSNNPCRVLSEHKIWGRKAVRYACSNPVKGQGMAATVAYVNGGIEVGFFPVSEEATIMFVLPTKVKTNNVF